MEGKVCIVSTSRLLLMQLLFFDMVAWGAMSVSQVASRFLSFILNMLVARRLTHEQFGVIEFLLVPFCLLKPGIDQNVYVKRFQYKHPFTLMVGV